MTRTALFLLALVAASATRAQEPVPLGGDPVPDEFFAGPSLYMWHLFWLVPLVQIAAVVHAVKTGRRDWIWIILFLPGIGAVAYLLAEVLPAHRRISARFSRERLLNALLPGREVSRIEERVEVSDTVENRRALARACVRAGRLGQAMELYESCLRGAFQDDPQTRLEIAATHFLAGRDDECEKGLDALKRSHPNHRSVERNLLHARVLDRLGMRTEAFELYKSLTGNARCNTEEARCRFAEMLEENGDAARAHGLYADTVKRSKGFPRHHRRTEREWIARARSGLRRTRRAALTPPSGTPAA